MTVTPARVYPWLAAALPVLAAVVVYLPALRNGFIWDDPTVILQVRAIRSIGDLVVLPPIIPRFYYRPFIFLTYLIDRGLGGETPFWFHASVIGWHALTTLLVFILARRLFPGEWLIASGGALLFATFPTHVESVAWMAGRSDVVVCALVLLTVLLCMMREQTWTAWAGGAALLLATLSKEMAVACVPLVPLMDLMSTRRLYWSRYVPLLLATGMYFLLRNHGLGVYVGGLPATAPADELVIDVVRALGFYLVRTVLPVQLCAYIPDIPQASLYLTAGFIGPLVALAGIVACMRRGAWPLAFLITWFFVTLAPSLMVLIRRSASAVVADRYLYVPTVGSCIALAWALVRLAERQHLRPQWPTTAIAVLCLLFSMEVIPYTHNWTDNLTFWTAIAAQQPADALPYRAIAEAQQDAGKLEDAERSLQRALTAKTDDEGQATTYNNLGNLYRRMARYEDALHQFDMAIKIAPHPIFYHNTGMALMAQIQAEQSHGDQAGVRRDIVKAREAFEQALALGATPAALRAYSEWEPAKTHALLAQVLMSLGDRTGAREHLDTALRLEPTGPVADLVRQYMRTMPQ